ncbi:MAG: trimeric intracellular cation channel family protein [Actinobacteria bacterium]|uniref:Unannotated protein n=1 Tax=freshwater metagenome TaxID=449393 RepID=A0A6J6J025_9ZZZZ|nr:trimeric intracellular cation channel family protein [Actinomycetota bacterium]
MLDTNWLLLNGTILFDIIGTLAFALSGLIEAARKKLDIVGMAMVSGLAAFGGGTLRDILLDRRPFLWVENEIWVWVLILICIGALLFIRARHLEPTERAMQWPDAIGLGAFTAGGTQLALTAGVPVVISVIMGVLTAIFGGVLRDIVVNEIPKAFSDHIPYAVIAFTGGWVVVGLNLLNIDAFVAVAVGAIFTIVLRVLALLFGWRLPIWKI